ncbi:hypothetical protein A0O34_21530 [Chryseobacterium glaciei]|uniref:Uncharacterized protein n=1 Tax=Chryseobacterium glaciei TaxID=1685010 RepID=A0A172Y155_9FLAO|nr:hypothetical protein [Chryseobacterium glaciei]ANF52944.1 hypothetical protein A0O34_21530 [Chryseobacterium glaciei]
MKVEEKIIKLTDRDLDDLYKAFVIAMKELDRYEKVADRILSNRLEVLLKKIERQSHLHSAKI